MTANRTLAFVFGAIVAAAASAAQAQTPPPPKVTDLVATAPGKAVGASSTEVTAAVVAVDRAKRTVSLKSPDGHVSAIDVGDEVKNFDQIKVGDIVRVNY